MCACVLPPNQMHSRAHEQNPTSAMPHRSVHQIITILRGSDHSLCLRGKSGIKHAPASGKHRGLSKGQFVSFNCCLSACLPNRIKLCKSFPSLKRQSVLHKNRVDAITIGHGLVQNNRKAGSEETRIQSF